MVVCIATEGGENVAKKQTSGNLALEQQRVIVIPAHDEIVARSCASQPMPASVPPAKISSIPTACRINTILN